MEENSGFFNLVVDRDPYINQLNELRKKLKYTDVKLQMGDKLFPAHRKVLSRTSPVLKALISDQWSTTNICPLSDQYVDLEIMEDLLSFLYTGRIKLTPDNVHPVCMAAHFLQISTLLEPSVKYLCQFITIENLLTLFKFSVACDLEELNYSCLRFVNNNHESVFQSSEILEFSFNDFKELTVGLKKFWTKMLREDTFHCIVRWTEKNLSERLNGLPALLKNIPLEELPLEFLKTTVLYNQLVRESISGFETVSAALSNYRTYSNPPWKSNQNMIVLGGRVFEKARQFFRTVRLYDSRSNVWRDLPEMPSMRIHCGVTVVNHQDIILCGGYVGESGKPTASVVMFEWSTQTWTELPEMPVICPGASAAICNDDLYVVGALKLGLEQSEYAKKVLRYSFKTQMWEFVASLGKETFGSRLIEYKNCLYAIGGRSNTIEKYEPAKNQWTIMTTMLNFSVVAVTVHQDKFYIYGSQGFEVYDPETNSFDTLPKPPFAGSTSLVSLNGKLLAVGGLHNINDSDGIFEFDFLENKWMKFGKMVLSLVFHSAVVGAFY